MANCHTEHATSAVARSALPLAMGWPWQQKPSEDECVECQEAKEAPKPASSAHGPCGDLYALVDACMQREDRKNVKDCAAEWKAFQACHSAHRTRR